MAIMKKMLFIINPRSGKEQIRSRLLEILDSFVKAGYGPSVYITQGPKDAEYQAARASESVIIVSMTYRSTPAASSPAACSV